MYSINVYLKMNISAVSPDKIDLTPSYDTVHEIRKKSAISDTTSVWVQRPKHKKTTLGSNQSHDY